MTGHSTPESRAHGPAWRDYLVSLDQLRSQILDSPFSKDTQQRASGLYLFHQVQAVAFNRLLAPNTDYPRFYMYGQLEPMTYSMGGGSADIQYRQAFVDGAGTYRIWGRRRNAHASLLQVVDRYWGDRAGSVSSRSITFDDFVDADGYFDIIASPDERPGNWLNLDRTARWTCIFFREIFQDWNTEMPSEIHIAPMHVDRSAAVFRDEEQFAEQLAHAARFMREFVERYSHRMVEDVIAQVGFNTMLADNTQWPGANAASGYFFLAHHLDEDDALVITLDWKSLPYWSVQVTDVWHQSCEPLYHQSSLNNFQAACDADGLFRLVLARRDPGVANWLDPVGCPRGLVELRVIPAREAPLPHVARVSLAGLGEVLPATTARIDSEARVLSLAGRREAAFRLWRY